MSRARDLIQRGAHHMVIDKSGHVVPLRIATVLQTPNGHYIPPPSAPWWDQVRGIYYRWWRDGRYF